MTGPGGRRRLVPAYLATAGSATATRNTVERMTVLTAATLPAPADLAPAAHRVLEQLRPGALTLVEVAAYLQLPPSVTRVIVSELVDRGLVRAHASMMHPQEATRAQKIDILERTLRGLRKL